MGKINGCLKCVFLLVNSVFGIFGGLMIIALVKTPLELSSAVGPGPWALLWVFSLGMLMVSILGLTAARTEKTALLKVFAGLMMAVSIGMMILGMVMASYRNKFKGFSDNISPAIVRQLMADTSVQEVLSNAQGPLQCCGFTSYEDWGGSIPGSCECSEGAVCTDRPVYSEGPARIYSRPCFPIVSNMMVRSLTVTMGMFFGVAVTAFLCLGASLRMIRQVRRHNHGAEDRPSPLRLLGTS